MKFIPKKLENELIWEAYSHSKIISENDELINHISSVFIKHSNSPDMYINIAQDLKSSGIDCGDYEYIKYAANAVGDGNITYPKPPVDVDVDEILQQLGCGGELDSRESDDLYGRYGEE